MSRESDDPACFKIRVEFDPEEPVTPLFRTANVVAELNLRIMQLEATLVYVDNTLTVVEPLVPAMTTVRENIAKVLACPERAQHN